MNHIFNGLTKNTKSDTSKAASTAFDIFIWENTVLACSTVGLHEKVPALDRSNIRLLPGQTSQAEDGFIRG